MDNRNGYFQLQIEEAATSIVLYSPKGEGKPFLLADLFSYLDRVKISYDMVSLKKEYDSVEDEPVTVLLQNMSHFPEREIMVLDVAEDKMSVTAKFYAPSNGGEKMDMAEILGDMLHQGIKAGLQREAIEGFLNTREYCKEFVFARGQNATKGEDAFIEYHFNTDLSLKPMQLEDGSVDFHNLNNICPVSEGDLLATLHKEKPGQPGFNVMGERIRPTDVRRCRLSFGSNVRRSEDHLQLFAVTNGHVSLSNGQVTVSNVYDVEDVGNATGNIEYNGTVNIKGNVLSGFKVHACGNIVVGGVVEGAELDAGGEIILKRGIQGGGRARIKAKGNVVAKFIESATVSAEGYVRTESILHSNVSAKGEVEVSGKKGFVTGGTVRSLSLISAKTIGSQTGGATVLEVGVDPVLKERFGLLGKDIKSLESNMAKLSPVLIAFGKRIGRGEKLDEMTMNQMRTLSRTYSAMEEEIKVKKQEYADIQQCLSADANACVKVSGMVYPGVQIAISDVSLTIKSLDQYCRFVKDQGEVCRKPL